MLAGTKNYQGIWLDESDPSVVRVIDQNRLPFFFETRELRSVEDVYTAISTMTVRGAPLIGAAAAFGIYLATFELSRNADHVHQLENAARYLVSCRPTAVNLSAALNFVMDRIRNNPADSSLRETALKAALDLCEQEKENCRLIGINGLPLIEDAGKRKNGNPVNILTHCNAGWLASIDYGTALAPVYLAHESGIPVHVWVDETRPRNQGSRLTAWELDQAGVPCTLIADNTGGHLMQHGMVDLVIVGSDRTTIQGDVANKIGTYLKALAAYDNNIPFYSAFPSTTLDFRLNDGLKEIPVEERDEEELVFIEGFNGETIEKIKICPDNVRGANYGFDITPARLIAGLITERGICRPSEKEIRNMFSDKIK
ncbi:MAG TPA: S-methyl-5-thioribose-1-phosphate isomerase [Bacteroidales bacterium]|jgi:methylthioribose-1-phosphate isomerase|nr:S-methyl-5-thioribose-1-phosphate isomerase [Bacteroidales bacterium]HQH25565.1 S-methyl-5-thioribose-1-phosphate isomerase [Bacteroidales bacterium]HQJ82643.1 S-methyl-5-thioribose-1-phosphate isomerase [Bacteroidales bacterium]